MVIVWPGFGVATQEAYSKVKLPFSDAPPARSANPMKLLFNRFESLVFPSYPALPKLKQDMSEAGARDVLMSGSGSAVYGLVNSQAEGENVLKKLQPRYPQSWLTHTV